MVDQIPGTFTTEPDPVGGDYVYGRKATGGPGTERKYTHDGIREYVLVAKEAVRVATVAAGTLATSFANGQTVDGITLATNDRILIKDQAAGAENGVYIVQATGAPVRASDFDRAPIMGRGVSVTVLEGTANANTHWVHTTSGAITVDTTALTFSQLIGLVDKSAISGRSAVLPAMNDNLLLGDTSNADALIKAALSSIQDLLLVAKSSVRVASTANVALATDVENGDAIDGVTLATGDRVLLKNQTAGAENGIYTVNASGAPTRATDFDRVENVLRGAVTTVLEGSTNAQTIWQHTTSGAITIDTTALTFAQVAAPGAASTNFGSISYKAIQSKTATYSIVSGEAGELHRQTGTYTVNLPASFDTIGKFITILNIGSGTITVSAGVDGINNAGTDTVVLQSGQWATFVYTSATDPKWSAEILTVIPPVAGTLLGTALGDTAESALTFDKARDILQPQGSATITAGAITLDHHTKTEYSVSLTASITSITINNWPASGIAGVMRIIFTQDATGGRTVTGWPAAVKWAGGTAPTITATANKTDVIVLYSVDGGTTVYGSVVGQDY